MRQSRTRNPPRKNLLLGKIGILHPPKKCSGTTFGVNLKTNQIRLNNNKNKTKPKEVVAITQVCQPSRFKKVLPLSLRERCLHPDLCSVSAKWKIYCCVFKLSLKPKIWKFHVVIWQATSKNCTMCVPHVQHDYFSTFCQSDHSFLASSLPLPLSLLKLSLEVLTTTRARSSKS